MAPLYSKTQCFSRISHTLLIVAFLLILEIIASYTSSSYDYDSTDQLNVTGDLHYDRQNHSSGQQNSPYDRSNEEPIEQNDQTYDQQNPSNGPPNYRYHPPSPDKLYYNQNNRLRYKGLNKNQYGQGISHRTRYEGNRVQYNRDLYKNNSQHRYRNQYVGNQDRYGEWNVNSEDDHIDNPDDHIDHSIVDADDDECCQEYCHLTDKEPYFKFGGPTAYELFFAKNRSKAQYHIPGCTPVQFWTLNRHGTRYPNKRTIKKMQQLIKLRTKIIENYDKKKSYPARGRLCKEDLHLLKKWRWDEDANAQNAMELTSQGVIDLESIGSRYASRFENLLRQPYSMDVHTFVSSNTNRTRASFQAYLEGLLGNDSNEASEYLFIDDELLKTYTTCKPWIEQVLRNPESSYENRKFKMKPEYFQLIKDVSRRLGFRHALKDKLIWTIYDLCRFEKAWKPDQPSAWCVAFNKDQLERLEYVSDLSHYYKQGYGNDLNKHVECRLLNYLYKGFELTVNNTGATVGNRVSTFFGHLETIQPLVTALGIAKDNQILTADNYQQQHNREWRTSDIAPFAANLAAVLYQCPEKENFRVMFFLNEVPVHYPNCSGSVCNWSTIKKNLGYAAHNCDMTFCNRSTALKPTYVISFITLIVSFAIVRL